MTEVKLRYLIYGVTAAVALAIYLWPDDKPVETGTRPNARAQYAELPALSALAAGNAADVKRDLFAVVAPMEEAPRPEPVVRNEPLPPPPPDRLAGVKIVGVVMRERHLAVLVEFADGVQTIETGQPFGQDSALTIEAVDGRSVLVVDSMANITKTYLLSEE